MKAKHHFRRVALRNRWTERWYELNDGTIIGIEVWWAGPKDYAIKLCLLGFELQFWFKREFID